MENNQNVIQGDKKQIFYSRDYRHLQRSGLFFSLQLIFVLVPAIVLYLCFYSELSKLVAQFSAHMISSILGKETTILETKYFPIFGNVFYVDVEGRNPSFTMALISLIVSLILIFVFSLIKTNQKPLMIFLTLGAYIHGISSLYFIVFGEKFPYTMTSYSILYMKQQIIVWLMIIIIYWLCTSLIPKLFWHRLFFLVMLIVFCGTLGVVRYIIYMCILSKFSYLFMASLYFTFGVLFDFMVMVGVFALFIRIASRKYNEKGKGEMWKWS